MRFDAIIIGAGPAGSATATLLAKAGWRVALVEKKTFPRTKVCGEFMSGATLPLLQRLGIWDKYRDSCGPEIRRVGLFARDTHITSPMPRAGNAAGWGRALGRHHLDTLLRDAALDAGAKPFQPATVTAVRREIDAHLCTLNADGRQTELNAPVLIAANGSWEPSAFADLRTPARRSDLFAFKARFQCANLPHDLMPLVAFPGGYGGMVTTDGGVVTLSCCIRRDVLAAARARHPARHAGESVLQHIFASCAPARDALGAATPESAWLATGPVRPGIRLSPDDPMFRTGNAAGEAHPVIAEGIAMALQSAQLLSEMLIERQQYLLTETGRRDAARDYSSTWRRAFALRIRASALFARLAMSRRAAALLPVITRFPSVLSFGAQLSGKTQALA
jgi:menaquinone-9 beta-reductase